MFEAKNQAIQQVIQAYFRGVFQGDIALLREVFHPQAYLFGDIKGQTYCKALEEYLDVVANRQSPATLGETFRMEILSIEILQEVAHVRVHCPMLGYNYYDYLALLQSEGKWKIANKLFTHADTTGHVE